MTSCQVLLVITYGGVQDGDFGERVGYESIFDQGNLICDILFKDFIALFPALSIYCKENKVSGVTCTDSRTL